MPDLPSITGAEAIKAFEKCGFSVARINGSHHIMKKDGQPSNLTVPVHGSKCIKRGTLRSLIRGAGLTVSKFADCYDERAGSRPPRRQLALA